MSNDLTGTPHLWILDSVGILSETPVWISKIIYIPTTAADDLLFKEWNENTTVATGTKSGETAVSIASSSVLTVTGKLPSTIADGHVFEITATDGDTTNLGKRVVESNAGNDNSITIQEDNWQDESGKTYSWQTFATVNSIVLKAGASDASPIHVDFGVKGRRFPNLTLETIDHGYAYVYLLIS